MWFCTLYIHRVCILLLSIMAFFTQYNDFEVHLLCCHVCYYYINFITNIIHYGDMDIYVSIILLINICFPFGAIIINAVLNFLDFFFFWQNVKSFLSGIPVEVELLNHRVCISPNVVGNAKDSDKTCKNLNSFLCPLSVPLSHLENHFLFNHHVSSGFSYLCYFCLILSLSI